MNSASKETWLSITSRTSASYGTVQCNATPLPQSHLKASSLGMIPYKQNAKFGICKKTQLLQRSPAIFHSLSYSRSRKSHGWLATGGLWTQWWVVDVFQSPTTSTPKLYTST